MSSPPALSVKPAPVLGAPCPSFRSGLVLALALAWCTAPTLAQETPADESSTPIELDPSPAEVTQQPVRPPPQALETIVVTAQKRRQSLQDVALSVQAFDGETLDALSIYEMADLQRITPGMTINTSLGFLVTFLRGIGTDAVTAADPSVATYVDGIYFPFAPDLSQNFGAVERVEVLKGPQGTLFGRNAVGGAIVSHTRNPEFDGVHLDLHAEMASFDARLARIYGNLPLTETWALNIATAVFATDNYYTGSQGIPPRAIPRDGGHDGRVKLRWQPMETLDIKLVASRRDVRGGRYLVGFNAAPSQLGTAMGIQPQTGYHGELDARTEGGSINQVVYGDLLLEAPWFDLRLLASDQSMDTHGTRDFDGSPESLANLEAISQYIDARSAELQMISHAAAGPDWLEWIAGVYLFRAEQGMGSASFYFGGSDLGEGTLGGQALPAGLLTLLASTSAQAPDGGLNLVGLTGTDSRSVFAEATVSLRSWLDLTLGARYQSEERWVVKSTVGSRNSDGSVRTLQDFSDQASDADGKPYPTRDTDRALSPKIALQLRPFATDTMLYASWQKASKAATYNTLGIYDSPDYVRPERLRAWELGLKTTSPDGHLRVNAAAFDYDIDDLQQIYVSIFAGGLTSLQNAARGRVRGFDIDLAAQLWPSRIDRLELSASAAWLHARYASFPAASGFDDQGYFRSDQDYSGNRIVRSPAFSASVLLSKAWWLQSGILGAGLDGYYSSATDYEPSNRPLTRQKAYWTLGARLGYLFTRWNLRLSVSVRNLGNTAYFAGLVVNDFGFQPNLAPPRTWALQLGWGF